MGQQVNIWCEQYRSLQLNGGMNGGLIVTLHIAQIKQLWYNDVVSEIRPET